MKRLLYTLALITSLHGAPIEAIQYIDSVQSVKALQYRDLIPLIKLMVSIHLQEESPKELTYIGDGVLYEGYQRENRTHTMGAKFTNILQANSPSLVLHLHPESIKLNRHIYSSMFSLGDIGCMVFSGDWIGIEFYKENGAYTIDIHYSSLELGKALYIIDSTLESIPSIKLFSIKEFRPIPIDNTILKIVSTK